jgi:hypothetical protein
LQKARIRSGRPLYESVLGQRNQRVLAESITPNVSIWRTCHHRDFRCCALFADRLVLQTVHENQE